MQRKFEQTEQPRSDTVQRGRGFRPQLDALTVIGSQGTGRDQHPERLWTRHVLLSSQEKPAEYVDSFVELLFYLEELTYDQII